MVSGLLKGRRCGKVGAYLCVRTGASEQVHVKREAGRLTRTSVARAEARAHAARAMAAYPCLATLEYSCASATRQTRTATDCIRQHDACAQEVVHVLVPLPSMLIVALVVLRSVLLCSVIFL